ncbi:MAG: malto-oligosyltrehalose trehalohydrolase [Chromatiaceae bacterium]|nr:MAG: malto-oligosyltrehalose trehalohydrolase [Chromatiaceae bacterium]
MPFGAEVQPAGGGVRFRLWAPAAARIDLLLDQGRGEEALAMSAGADGWFELTVPAAGPGQHYRYRIDGGLAVPDPASRFQPDDVHGPSEIIDPRTFCWADDDWRGRPWAEAVIYELHVGSFSPSGDYGGIERRLDHLVNLGITALELMPIADFPGRRNWGYDGALLFAPEAGYGRPENLKHLVQAAHRRGLMVLLDVVYNHFGPEGNYLHCYAPQFFHPDRHTPWGAAIAFDGPRSRWVREFFIHNACYWLQEYHLDGLRLDAVDRIIDTRQPDLLDELATRVRQTLGQDAQPARLIHLILENDHNQARRYQRDAEGRPRHYTAQWNDDWHHACHALLTGEDDGPYQDFAAAPLTWLARASAEGCAYQGERSAFRDGRPRGEPSATLPPLAWVNFLQNHDQAGNRAFGERLHQLIEPAAMDAALALLLLAPAPPLLFMGQEFDAPGPFLFFCDFGPDLAAAVCDGRRREFARTARFADPASRARIPDPNAEESFRRSCLDWDAMDRPAGRHRLAWHRQLLALRRRHLQPLLAQIRHGGRYRNIGDRGLLVDWTLDDERRLQVRANLGPAPLPLPADVPPLRQDQVLFAHPAAVSALTHLPPWSVCWALGAD